jgi:hypothetical protein
VRFTGGIGSAGVFLPADPGAPNEDAKQGKPALDYGMHWVKGQTLGNGNRDWDPRSPDWHLTGITDAAAPLRGHYQMVLR